MCKKGNGVYRRLNKKGRFGYTSFQVHVMITKYKIFPIIFSNVFKHPADSFSWMLVNIYRNLFLNSIG